MLHYSENGGEGRLLYMFTDHQGSVMRIYDADGNEQFSAEYSPWGYATVKKNLIGFTRGYTGHETLPDFRLIDMNGRLYDPVLGRFLSPDNYVQMPESSQSFNRYSYCLNNPLKYTDPSGQLFGIGALGVSSKFMMNMGCTVAGGLASWATGDNFFYGAGIGGNIGAYNHGWRYVKSEDCYYYDEELKEVIVTGKRSLTGRFVNYVSGVCTASQTIGKDVVMGNNGKYYFRQDNGKIFRGNQYVKTRAVMTIPHAGTLGFSIGVISEVPSVVYAANTYGVGSREHLRAITVAGGEIAGGNLGEYYGGIGGGAISSALIGSSTAGFFAAPAFFGGEIAGSICGGWLGTQIGGCLSGFMFDLMY